MATRPKVKKAGGMLKLPGVIDFMHLSEAGYRMNEVSAEGTEFVGTCG